MFVILIIACSEVAIVMTYFQLCGEDYHWWWRSYILSGASSFYVLAYSIIYYYTKVRVNGECCLGSLVCMLLHHNTTLSQASTFLDNVNNQHVVC